MQENNWNSWNDEQPKPERRGFAIASLILGILSLVLCCIGGGVLGIAGLALGIASLVKKESSMGMAVAGIITSVFGIIYGIAILIMAVMFSGYFTEHYEDILNAVVSETESNKPEESVVLEDAAETEDEEAVENPFAGKAFKDEGGAVIYFAKDGTFVLYQDDTEHEDNYAAGTYECYRAEFAEAYLMSYISEYGMIEDELAVYYEREDESELYSDENVTCLVLHNNSIILDGEEQVKEPYDTNYLGFYMNGCYDAANLSSGDFIVFTEP